MSSLKLYFGHRHKKSSQSNVAKSQSSISEADRRFSDPELNATSRQQKQMKHRKFSISRLLHKHHRKQLSAASKVKEHQSEDIPRAASCGSELDVPHDRDWRLSEMAHLDSYMKRACNVTCEEDMCHLPNRLCCAQLLKVFFLREEQRYNKEILHGRVSSGGGHFDSQQRSSHNKSNSKSSGSHCRRATHSSRTDSVRFSSSSHKDQRQSQAKLKHSVCEDDCVCPVFEEEESQSHETHTSTDDEPCVDDDGFTNCNCEMTNHNKSTPVFPPRFEFEIY